MDNYWNTPVDTLPLHPSSSAWVSSVGLTARLHADWGNNLADNYGIPFVTVPGSQPLVPILPDPVDDYSGESDPGPYPIPSNAPIEGGPASTGDRHVLVIETANCVLYELYNAKPASGGAWTASSYAKWPLSSNALRTEGWTSADAAGLPIFPGLVRWEEVAAGEINHAIRFTAVNIWGRENGAQKYLWPARHASGTSTTSSRPPMGARFRLKASFDISGFSAPVQVILRAFKKYGLVLADGGSNWFFQGVSDTNWPDTVFSQLGSIAGSNFEVVDTSVMRISNNSAQSVQSAPDLAVTITTTPAASVGVGQDLVYAVRVANIGSSAATGVVVTNVLPAGVPVVWSPLQCTGSGTMTCNVGTIAGAASTTLRFVVRPVSAGASLTNQASATTSGETVTTNNSASATVPVGAIAAGVPVQRYRLYSPVTLEHHFTTNLNEYTVLGTYAGAWYQEGGVGKVLNAPGSFNGVAGVPYYRLYCDTVRWHHWTTDPNEYYTLLSYPCWNGEGIDGYILPTATAGTLPLYRLVLLGGTGLHHWTIDANEVNYLTANNGWAQEPGAGFMIQ